MKYLTHIFDFFLSFSRKKILSDMSLWFQWKKIFWKVCLHKWLGPNFFALKVMTFGIDKFLVFQCFVDLFDFSRKLTSQKWYCDFNEIRGSGSLSALADSNNTFTQEVTALLNVEIFIFWPFFQTFWLFSKITLPYPKFWVQFSERATRSSSTYATRSTYLSSKI